jgi:hypothetical protein
MTTSFTQAYVVAYAITPYQQSKRINQLRCRSAIDAKISFSGDGGEMTTSVINFTPAALGDEVVAVACLLIPDQ